MQNGETPTSWRDLLAVSADVIAVVGAIVIPVIMIVKLPPPVSFVLIGVAATLLLIGITGHVFLAGAKSRESLSSLVPIPIEPIPMTTKYAGSVLASAHSPAELRPAPNLICLGDGDLHVEIDRHEVLRETEHYRDSLRAATARYLNAPNPPNRVGAIENVTAQISYYLLDWPNDETWMDAVYHPCWLGEERPNVTFGVNQLRHLIIGVFEQGNPDGFKPFFMTLENDRDQSVRLDRRVYNNCQGFRIRVKIIAGQHGEFGRTDDFILKIPKPGAGYEFYHLTPDIQAATARFFADELRRMVNKGDELFADPVRDWSKFYQEAHDWRNKTTSLLLEHHGRPLTTRFWDVSSPKSSPHNPNNPDDFYTQFLNLKAIAKEFAPSNKNDLRVVEITGQIKSIAGTILPTPIPDINIVATNQTTGREFKARSGIFGHYTIQLTPGLYLFRLGDIATEFVKVEDDNEDFEYNFLI